MVRRAALRSRDERRDFVDALFDDAPCRDALARAGLDRAAIVRSLDPSTYLGSTAAFIDRVLGAHRAESRK
jgi:hypothetical protein